MEYIKLSKQDFTNNHKYQGKAPTLCIKRGGLFILNRSAVRHLNLFDDKKKEYSGVSFCAEASSRNCFAILRDDSGWCLRSAVSGQAVFNNSSLARHIIDTTWDRDSHAVGCDKPTSMVFKIALLPVDDKNKDVFALIQKK